MAPGRGNWLPYAIVGLPITILLLATMQDLWRIYVAIAGWFLGGSIAGFGTGLLTQLLNHQSRTQDRAVKKAIANAQLAGHLHNGMETLAHLVSDYTGDDVDPRHFFSEGVLEAVESHQEAAEQEELSPYP